MPSVSTVPLEVLATDTGCLVRITGRGTMCESRRFYEYAKRWLEMEGTSDECEDRTSLTLDLSACERLDSTFLGCLVDLHKRFNTAKRTRFVIVAPSAVRKSLLGTSRLDRLLCILDTPPATRGEGIPLTDDAAADPYALGVHVMECHRR